MSASRTIRPLGITDDPTESTRLLPIFEAHYFWRAKTNSCLILLSKAFRLQMIRFSECFFPSFCFERRPDPWLRDLISAGTLSLFTFPFFRWTLIYMEVRYELPVAESPTTAESKRDGALEGAARHLRWNFCLLKPVKSPGEKARGRGGGERVERRDPRCKK